MRATAMAEMAESGPPYIPPEAGDKARPRPRHVEPGPALDDEQQPVRLRCYARCCGTAVWAGFHDFDGGIWQTRFFEGPDAEAELVRKCPGCGSLLFHEDPDSPHGRPQPHVFTLAEMDAVCAKERERLCGGGEFDERTLAALNCELGEGCTFDEAAVLYGRTGEELRAALRGWLDGGGNQIAT